MSKRQLSPACRALLVHCQEQEAWLAGDPIPITQATLLSAEQRGLVELHRLPNGSIESATITQKGREAMPGFGPPV